MNDLDFQRKVLDFIEFRTNDIKKSRRFDVLIYVGLSVALFAMLIDVFVL